MDTHSPAPPPLEDDEAELAALRVAVAAARADHRPDIPHEQIRAEMLRSIDTLRNRVEGLARR